MGFLVFLEVQNKEQPTTNPKMPRRQGSIIIIYFLMMNTKARNE